MTHKHIMNNLMKKLFFAALCLISAMSIQAQMTKVKVAYNPGDTVIYHSTEKQTLDAPTGGKVETTSNYDQIIVVKAKNDKGYVLEVKTTNVESDKEAGLEAMMEGLLQKLCADVAIEVQTDADGKLIEILNASDVVAKAFGNMEKVLSGIEASKPEMKQLIENAKADVAQKMLNQDVLMNKLFLDEASPLALNGKTLMTGMLESVEKDMGLKFNHLYTVTDKGKTVKVNSKMNLSRDELKALVLEQVKKNAPDQYEMIAQNIEMVLSSGMVKMESNGNDTYTFNDKGWVEKIVSDTNQDIMGAKVSSTGEQVIKYKNF